MLVTHAEEMGANAIISVRYEATELMGGVTEVLCYGTGVVVSPTRVTILTPNNGFDRTRSRSCFLQRCNLTDVLAQVKPNVRAHARW
jgi:hypothetical protein